MKRPRWRFNAAYRVNPKLSVGLEFNPVVNEVVPTANWIIQSGTLKKPLISAGTSSDRIFTPEGNQAYYLSFAKGIPNTNLAPYFSISYSEFEKGLLFPFGVNIALDDRHDLLPMHDGRNTHLLLTRKEPTFNVTLMLVKMKRFGVSFGWGF